MNIRVEDWARRGYAVLSRLFVPSVGPSGDPASQVGQERERRARLGSTTALGARAVMLGMTLLTVPLALGYLGSERYGIWLTISSLIALLSLTDLGIGLGLLNAVTRAIAADDIDRGRRETSSAFAILALFSIAIALVFAVVYPLIAWDEVFGVHSKTAQSEAGPATATFVAIFLMGVPLSVASNVRAARQEVYVVHLVSAAGSVLALVALLAGTLTHQGLPWLVAAMAAPPMIAIAMNGVVLFYRDAPDLRPSIRLASGATGWRLVQAGFLFFVIQMAMTIAFATDALVLSQILGAKSVAEYGVVQTLFTIPIGLVAIGLSPLWPAYGDAIARGEIQWARLMLRASLRRALRLAVPAALLFAALGGWFVQWWVGGTVEPPLALFIGFGIWTVQSSVGQAVAMLLNGANEIRAQAAAATAMAVANLLLSIALTRSFGVSGVIWGTVIAYGCLVLVPMALYVPGVLRSLAAGTASPQVASATRR